MTKSIGRADVAKAAGVSESTVSRALNDSPLISNEIKRKVREQAELLGYYPSRTATLFASNKSLSLGFVVPYYKNIMPFTRSYFPSLLDGLLVGAMKRDYSIGIVFENHLGKYRTYNELINSHSYDGLVFAITQDKFEGLQSMIDHEIPFVLVNNYQDNASSVYAKPDLGMKKAFEHASSLGHTSITYVTGDLRFKNGKDRLSICEELAFQYHITLRIIEGDFSRRSGFESLSLMKPLPSLVMTSSDRQAFGFMQACMEQGLRIPQDISVIGYDNFQLAGTSAPPLTTVDHPITEMGIIAAEMAIDMIQKKSPPEQRWIETGFVERKSTTPFGG